MVFAEIQQKYERKREKVGEKKFRISVITLSKFLLPKPANRHQLWQCYGRNRGKKFVAIVAMSLPKMGGKKKKIAEIWEGIKKKKKVLRLQYYFYN